MSAAVSGLVALGIEYAAKPRLEARKEELLELHRRRRELKAMVLKIATLSAMWGPYPSGGAAGLEGEMARALGQLDDITRQLFDDVEWYAATFASLLAEALADTHDTGRFREMARFFERAFRLPPAALVTPLASFLSHYDKLQYTRDEVERWHALRNRATHADRAGQTYALARDVRPVVMRVELAAYDVLFNKLRWNQPDTARRSTWHPAGGVLPDEQHAVLRVGAQSTAEARQLIDGFGAYPYDRTCKIGQTPDDWWLDSAFRVHGQSSIETVGSLRTAGLPANDAQPTETSTVHRSPFTVRSRMRTATSADNPICVACGFIAPGP